MIQINLLPPELRPGKKAFQFNREFTLLVGFGFGALLVVLFLFLTLIVGWQEMMLHRLEKQSAALESSYQEIREMKTTMRSLQEENVIAEKLLSHPILWSKKMNQISDQLKPGIWLTQLELQQRTITTREGSSATEEIALFVQGRVYSRDKDEPALIAKFISALKGDPDFYRDFGDIQLENIQSQLLDQTAVAEFGLVCPLKAKSEK